MALAHVAVYLGLGHQRRHGVHHYDVDGPGAHHGLRDLQRLLKMGGIAGFIDAEHALDPVYAKNIGVDIDNLYISQPDNGDGRRRRTSGHGRRWWSPGCRT